MQKGKFCARIISFVLGIQAIGIINVCSLPAYFFAAQLVVAPYQFVEIRVQIPSKPEFCAGFLSAIFLIVPHLGRKFCLTCIAPEGQKVIYFIK